MTRRKQPVKIRQGMLIGRLRYSSNAEAEYEFEEAPDNSILCVCTRTKCWRKRVRGRSATPVEMLVYDDYALVYVLLVVELRSWVTSLAVATLGNDENVDLNECA